MRFPTKEPTLLICKESKNFYWRWENLRDRAIVFWSKKRMVLQKENLNYQIQRELQMGKESILAKTLKW
jgi:hypothetical protein